MRSLFWRIFLSFWLAIALIGGLTFALGRWMVEERWLMSFYPHLSTYAPQWAALYEKEGIAAAQQFSFQQARENGIQASVLSADGALLSTLMPHHDSQERGMGRGIRRSGPNSTGFHRVTHEYTSDNGNGYVFRFLLPLHKVRAWQSRVLFWPLSTIIALLAVTLASWLLSLTITRPIHRLREAVEKLGNTNYQSAQLARISQRRDELGMLARDFNRMGEHLQTQIASQRQLLRDVSHELRSPLARLRIALGLAERQAETQKAAPELWARLQHECDRLDQLIGEILALARFDSHLDTSPVEDPEPVNLTALLSETLTEFPDLAVKLEAPAELWVDGWPGWLEKALSNLLRNAERFTPPGMPLEVTLRTDGITHSLRVRDHGPGCDPRLLPRLGEPFLRAPGQQTTGYGLGLAIAQRVVARHDGILHFSLPPDGGFQAEMALPARDERNTPSHSH